jgi:hypothetical protein
MTLADKRARRAWHRAILATCEGRELDALHRGWLLAARAWARDLERRRVGRYQRIERERSEHRPAGVLAGLRTRGERRAAIRAAVRERLAA